MWTGEGLAAKLRHDSGDTAEQGTVDSTAEAAQDTRLATVAGHATG